MVITPQQFDPNDPLVQQILRKQQQDEANFNVRCLHATLAAPIAAALMAEEYRLAIRGKPVQMTLRPIGIALSAAEKILLDMGLVVPPRPNPGGSDAPHND